MAKKTKSNATRRRKRPNVLIFMADTQGVANMSCHGYRRPTTPNLERFAKESALFENHFVTAPWTLPVHASLFTGRYESGHGAGAQHEGLEPGIPNMVDVFTTNGYRSVAFCFNHWATNPTEWSAGKGFQEIHPYIVKDIRPVEPFLPSENKDERDEGATKAIGLATKWIDDHAAKRDEPFFMFLSIMECHDPFHPPEPFRSRFLPEGVTYEQALDDLGAQQLHTTTGVTCRTLDEWYVQRCLKDGTTACVDDRFGRFVDALKERGVLDDTIVIFLGDHGDVMGEQVHYGYHSQNGVWDHACHTPLIVRYPKAFEPGVRCGELVQTTDVFPALMKLAGIRDKEAEASIVGKNLLDALKGPTREFALIEAQRAVQVMRRMVVDPPERDMDIDMRFCNVWHKAARTKRWKYIWVSDGNDMLFDIVKDPDERWNVIRDHPDIAKKLRLAMEEMLMSMEQRYYPDMLTWDKLSLGNHEVVAKGLRRLAAWGLYQPGVVPAYDPKKTVAELKAWRDERADLLWAAKHEIDR